MKWLAGLGLGCVFCLVSAGLLYKNAVKADITFGIPANVGAVVDGTNGDKLLVISSDGRMPYSSDSPTSHLTDSSRRIIRMGTFNSANKGIRVSTRKLVSNGWKASWSPDGKRIVYGKGWGQGLKILELDSGEITDLTSLGKDPVWSPDGCSIAYIREESYNHYRTEEVWLIKPSGGSTRRLADGGFPSWSVDGKKLFVQSRVENNIQMIDINDTESEPEVIFDGPQSWYPTVSPDVEQIAFGKNNLLSIVNRETGKTVLTWPTPGCRGLLPAWSPDGNRIAFGGFDGSPLGLWVLDVKTKEAIQVADGPYTMPAWSKDGTKLAFDLRTGSMREIWMVEVEAIDELKPSRPTMQRRYFPVESPRISGD